MNNNELAALLSSDVSDEEKRQRLIAATANNQDNHSAWLIHVKDIIREEGDEQLINEEPTARCNAINIIPNVIAENEEEDVVIVKKVGKTKSLLQRMKETVDIIMNKKN
jgi:protein phosphatase